MGIFLLQGKKVFAAGFAAPARIYASSELQVSGYNWSAQNVLDNNPQTAWSSKQLSGPDNSEWLTFDFGTPVSLAKIIVTPRVWQNRIQAFPKAFNIGYSDDGSTWKIIPGFDFQSFPDPQPNSDGTAPQLPFPVNSTYRFFGLGFSKATTDSYGGYFIQLADVRFLTSECTLDSDCSAGQSCRQGVCGVNTLPYWNLKPGSYWILSGTDNYSGIPLSFRQRYDLELPENICTDGSNKSVLTWRVTRDVACPYPHQCYWGNLRFMFVDPTVDTSPFIWATADKRYTRNPDSPFADIGTLYQHSYFSGRLDTSQPYVPPYLYSPKFLPGLGNNLEYRYNQNYYWNYGQPGIPIADENMCRDTSLGRDQADLIMRYQLTGINTPAYHGPALLVSQGEKSSWCTREDWYLAPNIGISRVDQWNCNTTGNSCYDGQHFGSCNCNSWTIDSGNHPNCYQNLALQDPAMSMSLVKYYLGHALQASVNNTTSVQTNARQTLAFNFIDPSTNFTYEGQLDTENSFISPDGNSLVAAGKWNTWVGTDGKVTMTIGQNILPGTYRTRFRPHFFSSPDSALQTNAESVTGQNNLPWSNEVTLTINPIPGDLNGDGQVNIADLRALLGNFSGIFNYNLVVANFGKTQ